ncbi:MAG: hypothetical protein LUD78_09015 [Clostridiales bacterium]|nr:hypothetical protein [Clostridiales bacterium]
MSKKRGKTVQIDGLDELTVKLERLQNGIPQEVRDACWDSAERMEREAKSHVYDGLTYQDGMIRDSIHALMTERETSISFGIFTDLDIAIYHEMGTGPVGTAAGYPGEDQIDRPISRRADGWQYYDESAVGQPLPDTIQFGKHKGEQRNPPGQVSNGLIYTEGVKPRAFMYNAVNNLKDAAGEEILDALMEVLADD